jgi:hypothetical protein
LKQNETSVGTGTDDDRRVEQIVDIIAFTTLQILFGEDNDTTGGSNNETDGIAYEPSPKCRKKHGEIGR